MIKAITVINYLGDSLKLELARPELSGFVVKSVTGLGPGKANINMTEIATNDGSLYNSSRLPSRNIVISLAFLWDPTIEDVRQRSYKYFPIKKKLSLIVETDNRLAQIDGYVESNEPTIFSKEEGCDISIICPDPFFYSYGPNGTQVTVFSEVESLFEFPFSNESISLNVTELSIINNYLERVITYDGDAPIGVIITIYILGPVTNLTLYNTGTRETMEIISNNIEHYTGSDLIAGDEIIICTVKGNKSVRLLRDGVETSILNCLRRPSDWFTLVRGDNIFAYTADSGKENIQLKVENRVVYEGV